MIIASNHKKGNNKENKMKNVIVSDGKKRYKFIETDSIGVQVEQNNKEFRIRAAKIKYIEINGDKMSLVEFKNLETWL